MKKKIIEIDDKKVNENYARYQVIFNKLKSSNLVVNATVEKFASSHINFIAYEDNKRKFLNNINNIMTQFSQTMHALNDLEGGIDVSIYEAKNIESNEYKVAQDAIREPIELILAEEDFFKWWLSKKGIKVQNDKDLGPYVEYSYNNQQCRYFYEKKKLKVKETDGTYEGRVDFYVPTNYQEMDLSQLDTFTTFNKLYSPNKNSTDNVESRRISESLNSIVINIIPDKCASNNATDPDREEHAKNIAAPATYLMNNMCGVTDGEIKTKKIHNVVGGGSRFGAYSMQIAADNGDLFDTVVCVNNALIITDVTGIFGVKSQLTKEQVKNLNGKNIYFINTQKDTNPLNNMNYNYIDRYESAMDNIVNKYYRSDAEAYKNGYTYTGIDYLGKYCPDANVYFTSDNEEWINIYKELDRNYSNVHVDRGLFERMIKYDLIQNYTGEHEQYIPVIQGAMRYDFSLAKNETVMDRSRLAKALSNKTNQ